MLLHKKLDRLPADAANPVFCVGTSSQTLTDWSILAYYANYTLQHFVLPLILFIPSFLSFSASPKIGASFRSFPCSSCEQYPSLLKGSFIGRSLALDDPFTRIIGRLKKIKKVHHFGCTFTRVNTLEHWHFQIVYQTLSIFSRFIPEESTTGLVFSLNQADFWVKSRVDGCIARFLWDIDIILIFSKE